MKRMLVLALFGFLILPLAASAVTEETEPKTKCPPLDFQGFSPHGAVGQCMQANCWSAGRCADAVYGVKREGPSPAMAEMQTASSCKLYYNLHKGSTCKGLSVAQCALAHASRLPSESDCAKLADFETHSKSEQKANLMPTSPAPGAAPAVAD